MASSSPPTSSRSVLLTIIDAGLAAILVLVPFFWGGETALGQIVICSISTLVALTWCLHQCLSGDGRWRFTGVEPIMLLGLGVVFLQCWELTPEFIRALSPRVPRLLTEWAEASAPFATEWNRISLTPVNTWGDFVGLVAAIEFFFVLVQRLQSVEDVTRFVRLVAVGGAAMAGFGLAQLAWGNGKFFWFYEHPLTNTHLIAKGAFASSEHFANYLALTLPAQLLMFVSVLPDRSRFVPLTGNPSRRRLFGSLPMPLLLWGAGGLLTFTAIACANSTSGLISSVVGILLALLIFWQKSLLTFRQAGTGLVGVLVILVMIPFVHAPDHLESKHRVNVPQLRSITNTIAPQRDPWKANVSGIQEFPLAGTGLGSHSEVFGLWFHLNPGDGEEQRVKNGYLQLTLETGITGLGLAVLLWLTSLLWCAQGLWNSVSPRGGGLMAVVASGLVMSLVQSGFVSVWYIPACVHLVLLYGVAAWRISLMRFFESSCPSRSAVRKRIRWGWGAAIPVVLLLGTWMVMEKLPALAAEPVWNEYLRLTVTQQELEDAEQDSNIELLERRISLARAAAAANPQSHELQLHAGLACLKQFTLHQAASQRFMPLSQIRDAARTLFESQDEMNEWLDRPGVLGKDRRLLELAMKHFQASLAACPLQPRPYLELAELVWLEGGSEQDERELVQQAVSVRPGDARAQFAMGRILWLEGAQKDAAIHWQNAFRFDVEYRSQLIGILADYVPARFFLDHFEPDYVALKQLRNAYRNTEDLLGYQLILDNLGRAAIRNAVVRRGESAAAEWMLAHECFAELGDRKNAYHTAKEAVISAPDFYDSHELFGLWLYRNGMFPEAVRELDWCLKSRPAESWLQTIQANAREQVSPVGKTQFAEEPGERVIR